MARRVLITGVANFWGSALAARLAAEPAVEAIVGVDDRGPPSSVLGTVDLIRGDLRDPATIDRVRDARPDVVVHNDVRQFAGPGENDRRLHDVNVIGTLHLLTACAQIPALRAVIVRGSAAIYGSEPAAPAFLPEELAGTMPLRTRFQRDLDELERLCADFSRRHPRVTCTVLRLQPVVGARIDTPVMRLFRLPVVPTVLGFDPRVQLLHEQDSADAILAAVRRPVVGAVNVAGGGAVSLARILARMGRLALPVAHPFYERVAGALARAGGGRLAPDMTRYLRFGRGVDLGRLTSELEFRARFSTIEAVDVVAEDLRRGGPVEVAP
ncbi:MAG TPA: NAD-dependent epimerase/dehydratase family protein [Solirubrobacteraceae bacterium]|nr:NAD-dependent epimerase/dehydratase family protein [Solirubrobacteraceae bacterium]